MSSKTSVDMIVKVGASGVAVLLIAYATISYMWLERPVPGCMADYQRLATFDLTSSDGDLLSPIELQARAGNGERGVTENARIVPVSNGPSSAALEVRLGYVDPSASNTATGVDFVWRPAASERATSACLRYSVWLPDGFDFARGGSLPGFFGGQLPEGTGKVDGGVDLRPRWYRDGSTDFSLRAPLVEQQGRNSIVYRGGSFARGRWTTVEQELTLNAPGLSDGAVRVWQDGVVVVDRKRLKMREDSSISIDGVRASVGFSTFARQLPTGEPGTLRLTPIEMAWR